MWGLGCFLGTLLVFVISLFEAWIVMLLWNWLMPMLFNLPEIGLWQMYGLLLLTNFVIGLFKR